MGLLQFPSGEQHQEPHAVIHNGLKTVAFRLLRTSTSIIVIVNFVIYSGHVQQR